MQEESASYSVVQFKVCGMRSVRTHSRVDCLTQDTYSALTSSYVPLGKNLTHRTSVFWLLATFDVSFKQRRSRRVGAWGERCDQPGQQIAEGGKVNILN
jgi:hypothetical protein